MNRIRLFGFVVLAALLASAAPAQAACTTTKTGTVAWKIVCDTGNEAAAAPTTDATVGLPINELRYVTITAEAADGQTFTAAPSGTVAIYVYNANVGAWARCRSCTEPTIKAASERRDHFGAFKVKGPPGRLMLIPLSVTLSAGNLTFYVSGSR